MLAGRAMYNGKDDVVVERHQEACDMPDQTTLKAQTREITGKKVSRLRAQGVTPANISGAAKPSVAIQVSTSDLSHLLKQHSAGVLRIQVSPGSHSENVVLSRVERDAVTAQIVHVDFRRVRLNQSLRVRVPVHLTGEAPAVKVNGGVLIHTLDTVEIESLPGNIPDAVTLDISPLVDLNTSLTVADIVTQEHIKIMTAPTEPVVTVKAPRIEVEEVEAAAEAPTAEAPEDTAAAEGGSES